LRGNGDGDDHAPHSTLVLAAQSIDCCGSRAAAFVAGEN
jgi:hypothetical protein